MKGDKILQQLESRMRKAVAHYWQTRQSQRKRQEQGGRADQGLRSAVTGGAQMDGFVELFTDLVVAGGVPRQYVFSAKDLEIPGFFRPTKEWDLVVVKDKSLLAAIEAKSQVGPSFGNNFNNRTEEAMGSALDLWTAYREHAYLASPQPFLGYFFMLEECSASTHPVKVREPHFPVLREFVDASYLKRYEIFCRKLVLERHYTASAFITSEGSSGLQGHFLTPAEDLSMQRFAKVLIAHVAALG